MEPAPGTLDLWWKSLLQRFLKEFLELVAPDLHAQIDWSREVEFIDKELLPPSPRGRARRMFVDCLFKVRLHSGETPLLLIHIEVQAQREPLFAKRMFRYFARLFLEYDAPILSFALLVDTNRRWRPEEYRYAFGGCELRFRFRVAKLLDFDRSELEQSRNPVALLLLAFLKARETAGSPDLRFEARKQLAFLARERGYNEELLAQLDELLEGIMALPEFLEKEFERALEEYKRQKQVPFISAAERIGLRRGLVEGYTEGYAKGRAEGFAEGRAEGFAEGRAEALREVIIRALTKRFGEKGARLTPLVQQVESPDLLWQIYEELLEQPTYEAFRQYLAERVENTKRG
ncbi:MAG: hypothetical protein RMJ83_00870 [Armatimonadota bacterium]|nr:hypothetical protein [Armatimonadota bacterium]